MNKVKLVRDVQEVLNQTDELKDLANILLNKILDLQNKLEEELPTDESEVDEYLEIEKVPDLDNDRDD